MNAHELEGRITLLEVKLGLAQPDPWPDPNRTAQPLAWETPHENGSSGPLSRESAGTRSGRANRLLTAAQAHTREAKTPQRA